MRQAGVLAAAGIVAITEMMERLSDDHSNAKTLAEGLAALDGIAIDPTEVETNLVFFELTREDITPQHLVNGLAAQGVKIGASGGRRLRAVLNHHVAADDVVHVLDAFRSVLDSNGIVDGEKVLAYG